MLLCICARGEMKLVVRHQLAARCLAPRADAPDCRGS
jgi:hypothetical protein